ncbi:MAG: PAS domain-containing sensor histidine kinase [Bacteroidales bacterium]|nr:PAS domain-containing sensor histidine kinase [Bacteroidales bacterium]
MNVILQIIPVGILFPAVLAFLIGVSATFGGLLIYRYIHRRKLRGIYITAESIFDESDQLNILINNSPDGIYIKDNSMRYVLSNNRYADYIKMPSPEEIYGKTDEELFQNADNQDQIDEDIQILNGIKSFIKKKVSYDLDGSTGTILVKKVPVKNKKGRILGIMATCSDITEQEIASTLLEEKNSTLEKERSLFRALMDNMPDTIYIKDTECRFLDGNICQVTITKAGTHQNLLGKTDFDFYPRDIAEIFYKDDKHVLESGKPVINKEEIGFDADGNILVKSTTKVPFRDSEGNIIGLVGIGRDITRQKEAEEKLKEQAQSLQEINVLLEERQEEINQQSDELSTQNKMLEEERNLLRTFIDSIPDYAYLKDTDGRYITVNKKEMGVLKTNDLDLIIGRTVEDFLPADYAARHHEADISVLRTGIAQYEFEEIGFDENGNFIKLLTSRVPFFNPEGEIVGMIGISRDITAEKETEIKLQEQAEHLKEANVLLEERQEEIQQQASELASHNNLLENERNLLRTLIDTLPDFIYIKDKESRFIVANKQVHTVMKVPEFEQLEGKTDFDYFPKKMAEEFYKDEQNIIKTEKPLISKEELGMDIDGNERIILTSKVPFYDAEGKVAGIVGVGRDITDIKAYEETLKKQAADLKNNNMLLEERQEEIQKQSESLGEQNKILESERTLLRTLIDNMPDYIYIKDIESRFLTVNKRLLNVMKFNNLDMIVGKTDFETAPSKEAAKVYLEDDKKIIESGKPIINKEEIGYDENLRERVISTTKVPFRDADGKICGIVGIGRDITKQKRAEEQLREQAQNLQEVNIILEERQEKIQNQSEEINKQAQILKKTNTQLEELNATKNKFFSIIAHDLKNPFQAIFGFSELLMRNYDEFENPQKMELLGMIKSSSESAYNLLENLLQWARTQTERIKYNPDTINIGEIIQQNIELSQASAENKHLELVSDVRCTKQAYADRNMINLVIRNLLSNAIKFTSEGGIVTIHCEMDEQNSDMISISIADTGVGIAEENIQKLFHIDEYFSTSGTAGESGTGLGLIICKEFVEKNKGTITIQSEVNVGTTFIFTLPVAE